MLVATLTTQAGSSLRCTVCVDTGADQCLFPLAFAVALGIDVLNLPRTNTGGVGTTSNVKYYAPLSIDLGQGIGFTCQAGFTAGMDIHGFGLLVQDGFFSRYDVHFSHKKASLTVHVPDTTHP